jgi:hypothetical protein
MARADQVEKQIAVDAARRPVGCNLRVRFEISQHGIPKRFHLQLNQLQSLNLIHLFFPQIQEGAELKFKRLQPYHYALAGAAAR